MGGSKSREGSLCNTILPQETRKRRVDNPALHLKQLEKEQETSELAAGKKS